MKDHSSSSRRSADQFDDSDLPDDMADVRARSEFRRSRVRRWRFARIAFWLSIPALVVWMAPFAVSRKPVLDKILASSLGSFDGRVTTSGASLGWLSPIRLRNLTVTDAAGEVVVNVPQIESERTLLGLLTRSSDPGLFRLIEPQVMLRLRSDGSNLEDLLASLPKSESKSASPDVAIEVVDGAVTLVDEGSRRTWRAERLLARVDVPGDAARPLGVKLETRVRPDGPDDKSEPGAVTADFEWKPGAPNSSSAALGDGRIQVDASALPLEFVAAWLRRFVEPQLQLSGELAVRGAYRWTSGDAAQAGGAPTHEVTLDSLDAKSFELASPKWLKQDRLRVPQLSGHGKASLTGDRLALENVDLDAGFARLQASGSAGLNELQGLSSASKAATGDGAYELRGEVDLARIAQLLPDTLRIREGTEITSGKVTATLTSRPSAEGRRWDGKVESSNLTAENFGRRVTWEQPIRVQLAALQTSRGLVVERLNCESSFLQAEGAGTLDDGRVALRGDLAKLSEELERFVDLGSSELQGRLNGELAWRRQGERQIDAQGDLQLEQLQLVFGAARPWREERLDLKLAARAATDGATIASLDAAELHVTAGRDRLDVELTEPVKAPSAQAVWPVRAQLVGHLDQWLPRVQLWMPLPGWSLGGVANVSFAGRVAADQIACEEGRLQVADFQARGPGLNVDEPQVQVDLSGAWSRAEGKLLSPAVVFTSSALAFRAERVAITDGERGLQLDATVGFRSDLSRLSGWLHEPGRVSSWHLAGMTEGQLELDHDDTATTAQWTMDLTKLTYAVPAMATAQAPGVGGRVVPAAAAGPQLKPVWVEPKLRVTGKGRFDGTSGELDVERCEVASDDLQVLAKGKLADLAGRCVVDLQGEIGYDLALIAGRFRPQLGNSIDVRGRDSQPFVLRGPLRNPVLESDEPGTAIDDRFASAKRPGAGPSWPPAELTGEAGLRWESITAYGLPIGAGEILGRLDRGAVDFKPLDVPVSEGRLQLAPRMVFEPIGPVVTAEPGTVLDNIRISPQVCSQWLKYVLPIVADVTEVDGQLSTTLSETAAIPLAEPLDGFVHGELDVRSVRVGPGPLSRELISLAQTVQSIVRNQPVASDPSGQGGRTWVEMPAQKVPFHWRDRRVHHERLQLAVKDVVILTSGSVGLDQTIQMTAEVPVRDEWLASNRYLQALRGQKLQLPITGTLSAPRIDRRSLQQIAGQAITGAARGALEQELSRGLDRFLKPPAGGTAAPGTAPPGAAAPGTPAPGTPAPAPSTAPAPSGGFQFPFIPKPPR